MIPHALFAIIAMPGTVAFVVPAIWLWHTENTRIAYPLGLAVLALGTAGLSWCVRDFYVQGKGKLASWSPPQHLVVVGLYRHSRNPMYVCVLLILLGWAAMFASRGLFGYWAATALALQLRVAFMEEPSLARRHGATWQAYASNVPRWLRFGMKSGQRIR
jgi:protein-S-isoprenylcysteine O-methyltransferase Ste14